METAALIARLILAALLLLAAIAKLSDRARFRESLSQFGIGSRLTPSLASLIPAAELLVAGLLVLPSTVLLGASLSYLLLLLFSGVIVYNLLIGRQPECSCFGQIGSSTIGTRTLIRNMLLALLAALLVIESSRSSVVSSFFSPTLLVLLATVAILSASLVAATRTRRLQAELARRPGNPEDLFESGSGDRSTAQNNSGDVSVGGRSAPYFSLMSVRGDEVSLNQLLVPAKPIVIFFVASDCKPCVALFPEIELWRHECESRFTLSVVIKGESARDIFAKTAVIEASVPILLDPSGEVSRSYSARWTPAAVLITSEGVIGSEVAFGGKEITALLDKLIEGQPAVV